MLWSPMGQDRAHASVAPVRKPLAPGHERTVGVMASEYWIVKHGNEYLGEIGYTKERLLARRHLRRVDAEMARLPGCRIVHVRIRPRSERLYLAHRLANWQPIVIAALQLAKAHDEHPCGAEEQDIMVEIVSLAKRLPKEDRP